MSTRMKRSAMAALLALAGVALVGSGQPDEAPPPPPAARESGEAPEGEREPGRRGAAVSDPVIMRARLVRMIESLDARRERLASAVTMLDEGASPQDVWTTIRERGGRGGWDDRESRAERRPPPRSDMRRADTEEPDQADGPGKRPEGFGFVRLSEAQYTELRAMIRTHLPQIDEGLAELEERDPEAARAIVGRLAPRLLEVRAVREHDGELAAIRLEEIRTGAEVIDVMSKIHKAAREGDDAAVESLRGELRTAVERQFDARAKAAVHEIEAMEARLRELREAFEARQDERDAEVDAAVERAMRRAAFRGRGRGGRGGD